MLRRYGLQFLAACVVGGIIWIVSGKIDSPADADPVSPPGISADSQVETSHLPAENHPAIDVPRSRRHLEGAMQKARVPGLESRVKAQEMIVEEKRVTLAEMVRTKAIFFTEDDSQESIEEVEATDNKIDSISYVDAKLELEAEMLRLLEMKETLDREKGTSPTDTH